MPHLELKFADLAVSLLRPITLNHHMRGGKLRALSAVVSHVPRTQHILWRMCVAPQVLVWLKCVVPHVLPCITWFCTSRASRFICSLVSRLLCLVCLCASRTSCYTCSHVSCAHVFCPTCSSCLMHCVLYVLNSPFMVFCSHVSFDFFYLFSSREL